MQGPCAARTTHFDNSYDVTISTYSLPDLYLPKIKNALFVAPESKDFLVLVPCNVHLSAHPLNKQQEQITLLEGENRFYLLNGEGLEPFGNFTVEI